MKFKTRTRQLANGKWVGEYKSGLFSGWVAADARDASHRWPPGDMFYSHCQVDTEQAAERVLLNHLATRWGI